MNLKNLHMTLQWFTDSAVKMDIRGTDELTDYQDLPMGK